MTRIVGIGLQWTVYSLQFTVYSLQFTVFAYGIMYITLRNSLLTLRFFFFVTDYKSAPSGDMVYG